MGIRLAKPDNVTGNEAYTLTAAKMLLTQNSSNYTNDATGTTHMGGGPAIAGCPQQVPHSERFALTPTLISKMGVAAGKGSRLKPVACGLAGEWPYD